jgi:hypothetical protein
MRSDSSSLVYPIWVRKRTAKSVRRERSSMHMYHPPWYAAMVNLQRSWHVRSELASSFEGSITSTYCEKQYDLGSDRVASVDLRLLDPGSSRCPPPLLRQISSTPWTEHRRPGLSNIAKYTWYLKRRPQHHGGRPRPASCLRRLDRGAAGLLPSGVTCRGSLSFKRHHSLKKR